VIAVRVPASTANLGPGFDALGLALSLTADVGTLDDPEAVPSGARVIDERHPADVAFRRGGGVGPLWVRSPIPSGRGLGYSGAMRVGGLALAARQRAGEALDLGALAPTLLEHGIELEGHADNVAASLHGGLVATAAGRVVRVRLGLTPAVVVWVPAQETSTQRSRHGLPSSVSFGDAAFNVGRTALLVAALGAGDVEALRWATADRLHQDRRLAAAPGSRLALAAGLDAGAWCGWLSGSGPSIAFLADPEDAPAVAAALPAEGRTKLLAVADEGVMVVSPTT
jgi:homoserine kinase